MKKYSKHFWYDPTTGQSFDKKIDAPKNAEYWDSVLEFQVYEKLLTVFKREKIKRQVRLTLFEKTSIFPAWTWDIDFYIERTSYPILVEAKGRWLSSNPESKVFWHTLKMLQTQSPELFNNLIVVGNGDKWLVPNTKIFVYPLNCLTTLVKEKCQIF